MVGAALCHDLRLPWAWAKPPAWMPSLTALAAAGVMLVTVLLTETLLLGTQVLGTLVLAAALDLAAALALGGSGILDR